MHCFLAGDTVVGGEGSRIALDTYGIRTGPLVHLYFYLGLFDRDSHSFRQ